MALKPVLCGAHIYQTKDVYENARKNLAFRFDVAASVNKFLEGDWGTVCTEDSVANDEAIQRIERVIGSYQTSEGELWVIAESDDGKKYTTITVLFPHEY